MTDRPDDVTVEVRLPRDVAERVLAPHEDPGADRPGDATIAHRALVDGLRAHCPRCLRAPNEYVDWQGCPHDFHNS